MQHRSPSQHHPGCPPPASSPQDGTELLAWAGLSKAGALCCFRCMGRRKLSNCLSNAIQMPPVGLFIRVPLHPRLAISPPSRTKQQGCLLSVTSPPSPLPQAPAAIFPLWGKQLCLAACYLSAKALPSASPEASKTFLSGEEGRCSLLWQTLPVLLPGMRASTLVASQQEPREVAWVPRSPDLQSKHPAAQKHHAG